MPASPGEWHAVPVSVPRQIFGSGVAAAIGWAVIGNTDIPAAKSVEM